MNLIELNRALKQLRLGGIAAVLETRLHQAQAQSMAPIDLISCLISDELSRRSNRLLERRQKQAQFRDPQKTLDNFDFTFNKKLNRSLVFDLATAGFVAKHEDALFLGPPGTGKSHLAQAIGLAAIHQGYRVLYRETHTFSMKSLKRPSMAHVNSTWKIWPPCHCSSLMISACVNSRRLQLRICWRSSCAAMSGPALYDLESPGGRLGETTRRQRGRHRHARSPPPPRSRAQMRSAQLENQNGLA